jgi:hypothetical protein
MSIKPTLLALALGLSTTFGSYAQADVVYTVFNPARTPVFTLFEYDSASFITTDTVVGINQLSFANPANTITSVEFIPSSLTYPGTSELDVFQSGAAEQSRYYPIGTFTQIGVTPGDSSSFGYPSSELRVAVPEPPSLVLLAAGLLGLIGLRGRARRRRGWGG